MTKKFKLSDIKITLPHVIALLVFVIPIYVGAAGAWHKIEHLIKQVETLNKNIAACIDPEPDLD